MTDERDDENEHDNQQHMPWNEGLPTAPDVAAIQKQWPDLKVGDRIEYTEIAELLRLKPDSNRFGTVTKAWRRAEEDKGRVIECQAGVAFYVASAEQVSAKTYQVFKFIGRKARRHRLHLSLQRPTDPVMAQTIAHQGKLSLVLEREARRARQNLLPSTPAPNPPRIKPPTGK